MYCSAMLLCAALLVAQAMAMAQYSFPSSFNSNGNGNGNSGNNLAASAEVGIPPNTLSADMRSRVVKNAQAARTPVQSYGGPILSSVHVAPVYWSASVTQQDTLDAFYADAVTSSLFDNIAQYGVNKGTAQAGIVLPGTVNSAGTLFDNDLRTTLAAMFDQGIIPTPTAGTYYPIHLPPGLAYESSRGARSCVDVCALHDSFFYNGILVPYGVIMSTASGDCNLACGWGDDTDTQTYLASHELIEAVTNPAVGAVTSLSPPLAWYSSLVNGEIGDICEWYAPYYLIGSQNKYYLVSRVWSMADRNCV